VLFVVCVFVFFLNFSCQLINHPIVCRIAKNHNKDSAQIMIRWAMQVGCIVLPKSSNPDRIASNATVFDFELTAQDMEELAALNEDWHCTWNPYNIEEEP
jgi:methylglyoxal/glyoxal reductase